MIEISILWRTRFPSSFNSQECKIEKTVEKLADKTVRLLADKVLLYDDV